jgi:hypothetical protein
MLAFLPAAKPAPSGVTVNLSLPAEFQAALAGLKAAVADASATALRAAWYDGCRTGAFCGLLAGLLLGYLLWRLRKPA